MTLLNAMRRNRFLIIAVLTLTLNACMSAVGKLPALPSDRNGAYLLGPGDNLQIVVFGDTDLTGAYRVSDGGGVAMPLVGIVPAQGLSLSEFQQKLIDQLKIKVMTSPNVSVSISEYRPFFILGEVKNPGSYPYVPNMSVLTAVAVAGGFTYRASQNEISVTRTSTETMGEWRASRYSRVLPGDVVYVFERHL